MTVRNINWVLVVKSAWLAANLTGWLMGLGSCVTEPNCSTAGTFISPILFLLSFPGSILFFIANEIFLASGVFIDASPSMHYTFLSLGTLTIGYIQWFYVFPALFGKQDVTVLALSQKIEPSVVAQEMRPCSRGTSRIKTLPVQPFDKFGRSPLDRVINQKQHGRLRDAS
jgi:hypothetical protein